MRAWLDAFLVACNGIDSSPGLGVLEAAGMVHPRGVMSDGGSAAGSSLGVRLLGLPALARCLARLLCKHVATGGAAVWAVATCFSAGADQDSLDRHGTPWPRARGSSLHGIQCTATLGGGQHSM